MGICCYEFVSADFDTLVLFLLDYSHFNFVYAFHFIHKYNLSIFLQLGYD
jgi:hypothetical protein